VVAEEPVVVAEEPVVVAEEPVVDEEPEPDAPASADPFTPFQPIMHEDAQPEAAEEAPAEEPQPLAAEPSADDPVVVRSVETVSAIDLVMGDDDEEQDPATPPAGR
jgi:hypothetical protein